MKPTIEYAERITREFNRSLKDADKLLNRPKITYQSQPSRATKHNRVLASTSFNDIMEATDGAFILEDPRFRAMALAISRKLNS